MLLLASASPRRKELLKKLVPEFLVFPANIDERILDNVLDPRDLPKEESKLKAYDVFRHYPNDEILACDTIVIVDGRELGKPKSKEEAYRMLAFESAKKQIVLSGYTYLSKEKEITRTVRTEVYFNSLSEEQIHYYVDTFLPLDKAGSYGIQDDFPLIQKIVGSYDNVMGLPTEDLAKHVFIR